MSIIRYTRGDLFQLTTTASQTRATNAPILLAHACNCLGYWSGGIALIFKQKFPSAYKLYKQHCSDSANDPAALLGTTLMIPVSEKDGGYFRGVGERVIIVCLFTSIAGGDTPKEITECTELAMSDLRRQLMDKTLVQNNKVVEILGSYNVKNLVVNMPKINAGIFGVPWKLTETALTNSKLNCTVFEL